MSTNRVDTVDKYFQRVNCLEKVKAWLFYFSIVLTIAIYFTEDNSIWFINYILTVLFMLVIIIHFCLDNYISLFLLHEAQDRRRTQLLSDSFDIAIDNERTYNYYNNVLPPSLLRLCVNVFESCLHTMRVTEKMMKYEFFKIIFSLVIFFIFVFIRETNINFVALIASTLFASTILVKSIKIIILYYFCKSLFEQFRSAFLNFSNDKEIEGKTTLLDLVFKYETRLANLGVSLNSDIFHQINNDVSQEWKSIEEKLEIQKIILE